MELYYYQSTENSQACCPTDDSTKRKFKALQTSKNIIIFYFDSQLTGQIQNKNKILLNIKEFYKTDGVYNIKEFYKTDGVYSYNQWDYFQRGCMDKWRSGDFSIQTSFIPLEVFASKIIELKLKVTVCYFSSGS